MIITILITLGLVFGSFINALVWRLQNKRDWVRDRSECIHCKHKLSALDLIPVLSWLMLRGRCRYCGKKIEDSPLTELFLGIVFVISYLSWPFSLSSLVAMVLFMMWLVILTVFAILCVYDFKSFLLPDKFTYPLTGFALVFGITRLGVSGEYTFIGLLLGLVVGFGLFYVLYQVSSGDWIGGGDVKLGAAAGLLAGSFNGALAVIFLSSLLGTLFAIPLIVRHKRVKNLKVPYGPFIILATIVVVLYSNQFNYLLAKLLIPAY